MPDLRGADDAEDPVHLVQPRLIRVVQDTGGRLAVGGPGGMGREPRDFLEPRGIGDEAGRGQREARADAGLPAEGAPAHRHVRVGTASLGEEQQGEEVCFPIGLGAPAEFKPGPAAVLLGVGVPPVQGVVGRLDVIAEALVVLAQRVDVVAGDLAREEEQGGQRHER